MSLNAPGAFEGKYVVVSGASSGIGRAVAAKLGAEGARLILLGRDEAELETTASLVPAPESKVIPLDLRDHQKIMPAIKSVSEQVGGIYGLCHAAGTVETVPLSACKPDRLMAMMEVNYVAGMELARAVCRRDVMTPDAGSILFISSIYTVIGKPGQISYSASKGAIVAAARAMAIELAKRKVRVNVLSPGMVRTRMTEQALSSLTEAQVKALEESHPLGFGAPEDVASAAAFLLSPESAWITAANLVVDGGCSAQ